MSIWFVLWVLLSIALVVFMGWTLLIAYRQKKVWKDYAGKKKLRYKPKGFMSAPEMNGVLEGYTVSLFTGEHIATDMKGGRKLTAVELHLKSEMPVSLAVASGGLVSLVQGFGIGGEVKPDYPDWDEAYIAVSESPTVLKEYLTQERLKILTTLMKIRNIWLIFVVRGDTVLLRLDTPEPLDSAEKLDKLMRQIIKTASVLELNKGEGARLKSLSLKKDSASVVLEVSDDETHGLQLEEDEGSRDRAILEDKDFDAQSEKPESDTSDKS